MSGPDRGRWSSGRHVAFLVVLAAELLVVSLAYTNFFEFECRSMAPAAFCSALSSAVLRAMAIIGLGAVFVIARPTVLRRLVGGARPAPHAIWTLVQIAGFVLVLMPWFFLTDDVTNAVFVLAVAMWLCGACLAAAGAALALLPAADWIAAGREVGLAFAVAMIVAAFGPEIADRLQRLWQYDMIAEITFAASRAGLELLGETVISDVQTKLLEVEGFGVLVGRQCSGVEGFGLITGFLLFYMWLFRSELRFPRVLVVLPVGIALSWLLNVTRIVILIEIGAYGAPDLAIGGFHSHAGWLMFTVLSVGFAATVHRIAWFRRGRAAVAVAARRQVPPLRQDPIALKLLPFAVFMASSVAVSAFFAIPATGYPIRFAVTAFALALFWRLLVALDWRISPVAVVAGLAVGGAWLATAPVADATDVELRNAIAAMPAWAFAVWAATRILGTTLVVPLVEELFFRGYVLWRLDRGGLAMRVVAVVVSSALFGLLHERWWEALLAGAVFGILMLRSGRLSDAIVAHAVANAVIAGWALTRGAWHVI